MANKNPSDPNERSGDLQKVMEETFLEAQAGRVRSFIMAEEIKSLRTSKQLDTASSPEQQQQQQQQQPEQQQQDPEQQQRPIPTTTFAASEEFEPVTNLINLDFLNDPSYDKNPTTSGFLRMDPNTRPTHTFTEEEEESLASFFGSTTPPKQSTKKEKRVSGRGSESNKQQQQEESRLGKVKKGFQLASAGFLESKQNRRASNPDLGPQSIKRSHSFTHSLFRAAHHLTHYNHNNNNNNHNNNNHHKHHLLHQLHEEAIGHLRSARKSGNVEDMGIHEQRQQAAAYLHDALAGRLKNGLGSSFHKPPIEKLAFRLHASKTYKRFLRIVSVLLCCLMLIEPRNHAENHWPAWKTNLGKSLEVVLLLLLSTDLILRATYMSVTNIFEKTPLRVFLFTITVCFLDVIISIPTHDEFRFSRALRPLTLISVDKNALLLVRLTIKASKQLLPLAVLLLCVVVVFGLLFTNLLPDQHWKDYQSQSNDAWPYPYFVPFNNFANSALTLLSLVTFEPYPDLIVPYMNFRVEMGVLFVVFIVVSALVLLNLVVAVQVNEFRKLQKELAKAESKKEKKTLMLVFHLAKNPDTHVLDKEAFNELMAQYKPHLHEGLVDVLFHQVDHTGDGLIDIVEFFDFCNVLRLEYAVASPNTEPPRHTRSQRAIERITQHPKLKLLVALQSRRFRQLVTTLVTINVIILATITDNSTSSHVTAVRILDSCFVALFVFEMFVKVKVFTWRVFRRDGWNRMSLSVTFVSCVLLAALPLFEWYVRDRLHMPHPGARVHCIGGAIRFVRVLDGFQGIKLFFLMVVKTAPIVVDFAQLLMSLLYSFSIICLEAYPRSSYFATIQQTWLTALRIVTLEGWHEMMFGLMGDQPLGGKVLTSLLFLATIFTVDLVILSQFMAVLYEVFVIEKEGFDAHDSHKVVQRDIANQRGVKFVRPQSQRPWRHKYMEKQNSDVVERDMVKEAEKQKWTEATPNQLLSAFEAAHKIRHQHDEDNNNNDPTVATSRTTRTTGTTTAPGEIRDFLKVMGLQLVINLVV